MALCCALAQTGLLLASNPRPRIAQPPATAPTVDLRIDPNTATADELMLLPRIGPALAAAIIAEREHSEHQPAFRKPEDLDRVPRIGPRTVELLRPHLRFPDAAGAPAEK